MFQIDWRQKSTIRGAVWSVGGLMAAAVYLFGKDPMPLILVTQSVAGGIGVAVKD